MKHISQMVVQNGDESHGIESGKKSQTKTNKKGKHLPKLGVMAHQPLPQK